MKTESLEKDKISYEDFLAQCDEDTWAEWVDGEVNMVSPASERHQDIFRFLMTLLSDYAEFQNLGRIIPAPFQMRLESSGREPDILYIASAHLDRIKDTYLEGPADMVVEIISKESRNRDRGEKFYEYESAGISEYWLVDPIREQVEFYKLGADSQYHLILPDAEGLYHSEAVPGFQFKVSWLWQKPLPSVLTILRELNIL